MSEEKPKPQSQNVSLEKLLNIGTGVNLWLVNRNLEINTPLVNYLIHLDKLGTKREVIREMKHALSIHVHATFGFCFSVCQVHMKVYQVCANNKATGEEDLSRVREGERMSKPQCPKCRHRQFVPIQQSRYKCGFCGAINGNW